MKRSKLFLTATTVVLGIVAFAASKANRTARTGCLTTSNHSAATRACFTINSKGTGSALCTTLRGSGPSAHHYNVVTCVANEYIQPYYTKSGE